MGVECVGVETILENLRKTEANLQNPTEFKERAALFVMIAAKESHNQQGPGWEPNDPATIKRKGHSRILEGKTKRLVNTMGPVIATDYVGVIYKQYYGKFHQSGKGVPQRAVKFTAAAKQAIVELGKKELGWKS